MPSIKLTPLKWAKYSNGPPHRTLGLVSLGLSETPSDLVGSMQTSEATDHEYMANQAPVLSLNDDDKETKSILKRLSATPDGTAQFRMATAHSDD